MKIVIALRAGQCPDCNAPMVSTSNRGEMALNRGSTSRRPAESVFPAARNMRVLSHLPTNTARFSSAVILAVASAVRQAGIPIRTSNLSAVALA